MHYYSRHIGDYSKDTGGLSLVEHGAYAMLLDWAYATERELPPNENEVFRLVRAMTTLEKRAVKRVMTEFFPNGRNKRVMEELELYRQSIEKARLAGEASGRARKTRAERPFNDRSTDVEREWQRTLNSKGNGKATGSEPPMIHDPRSMNQYPSDSPSGEEQIPTVVTIDMAGKWLGDAAVAGADYTAAEVTQAWKDYHATRFPSGQWRHNVTGKVPVTDWRLALESQIQFNRELAGRATGPASSPHGVSRFGSEKKTGGPSVAKQLWDVEHEMAEVRQRLNDAHELNAEPAAEDVERERELMKKLAGLNE